MVVFVDLEGDDEEVQDSLADRVMSRLQKLRLERGAVSDSDTRPSIQSRAPSHQANVNGFSAVLGCYPVALSLASRLDLNDLHALSTTCRQIHHTLIQCSRQLVAYSLRCTFDSLPQPADDQNETTSVYPWQPVRIEDPGNTAGTITFPNAVFGPLATLTYQSEYGNPDNGPLLASGRIGACARDLVAECRKCGTVVCRNCTIKMPSDRSFPDRFRRLCKTCIDMPLWAHLEPFHTDYDRPETPPTSSASSVRSIRSSSSSSTSPSVSVGEANHIGKSSAFTAEAFLRGACTCATRGVYLCTSCGQNLRAADTTYKRVWTWRSRYSTHIGGGLGTGLGVGDQGQKCGRGEQCLETGSGGVCWVEIDCSEGAKHDSPRPGELEARSDPWGGFVGPESEREGESLNKPGYLRQEMEGIGGVVKKKVKKRIKVGATVWEYEDERKTGKYLEREASGKERSWCGWCSRVVLGEADRAAEARKQDG